MNFFRKLYYKHRNNKIALRKYEIWATKRLPTTTRLKALSEEQKKEVDAIWSPFWFKPGYAWHELEYAARGEFSAEIVPCDVFYNNFIPKLNHIRIAPGWNDKAYGPKFFSGLPVAETVVFCIDGYYYNSDYEQINVNEVLNTLKSTAPKLIIKPSRGPGCGFGVSMIETCSLNEESLSDYKKKLRNNFLFQIPIRQSKQLSGLNRSSVNILRVNSLHLDNEIIILNTTIRFGIDGSCTDVGRDSNGEEVLNLLGVDKSGHIMDKVFHYDGSSTPIEQYGLKPGTELIGYDKVISLSIEAHKRLHHFDFVGFDITIDENHNPVLIEANLGQPGIFAYQYVHGPLFGKYLSRVISLMEERAEKK